MSVWTDLLGSELRTIDIDGVSTRVLSAGEGQTTVVLLHGRGGHLECWRANVKQLADHGRVVAFDLLGHGLTGQDGGTYSIAALAAHAARTVDELGLVDVVLVGQSIGGWVAVELALRRPQLVRAVALVEPAGLQSEQERLADPKVAAAYERGGRAFDTPTRDAVLDRLRGLFADPSQIDDELIDIRHALYAPEAARAVHRAVRAADNSSVLLTVDRLARVRVPVLFIHGERANTPDRVVAAAAAALHTEVHTLAATKQWPQYEAPAAVNELLISFIHDNEA